MQIIKFEIRAVLRTDKDIEHFCAQSVYMQYQPSSPPPNPSGQTLSRSQHSDPSHPVDSKSTLSFRANRSYVSFSFLSWAWILQLKFSHSHVKPVWLFILHSLSLYRQKKDFQIIFEFHKRKSVIQDWNDMRVMTEFSFLGKLSLKWHTWGRDEEKLTSDMEGNISCFELCCFCQHY